MTVVDYQTCSVAGISLYLYTLELIFFVCFLPRNIQERKFAAPFFTSDTMAIPYNIRETP